MSLRAALLAGGEKIGVLEITRQQYLDLSDKAAIADVVSTYTVRLDGEVIGEIRHRYGDGAWKLLASGARLAAGHRRRRPAASPWAWTRRDSRTGRIIRALAAAPDGLTVKELLPPAGLDGVPRQRAQTWTGAILRRYAERGFIERGGQVPGHWQMPPQTRWKITGLGRELIAWQDKRESERR